jgi:ABC-type spermidine/putrescine transport system permease subunit II
VFHEFEMASLWQRPAWTVAIFDFQAQGYVLEATWRRMGGVLLLQGLLLWLGFVSLRRAESGGHHARGKALTRGDRLVVSGYLVVAGLLTAGIPSMLLLVEALPGWERLWRTFSMGREVAHSLVVAFVAATVAYFTAQGLVKVCHRHPGALLLLVPGLSGALTLGLSLHSAIQWSPLHGVRDRPLPMVFGLGLLVLPWLTVLLAVARQRECGSAGWLAQRAHAPRLLWSYVRAPRLAIWSLGFYWSYLDVVVSALLAPSSVTPVMTRLYNLMHYGHDTMLSAYVMVILAAPLGVVALAFALGRWLTWKSHA